MFELSHKQIITWSVLTWFSYWITCWAL